MSNVLKGFYVSVEEDKRVVDSNSLVEIKIKEDEERRARLQAVLDEGYDLEEGFQEGLPISSLDALVNEDSESTVIKAENPQMAEANQELENLNAQIEEAQLLLGELQAQADAILSQANEQAEQIKTSAYEEAKNEGYQAGYADGMNEVEALKAQVNQMAQDMEADYQNKLENLEPQFIEHITDIYEHIFKVDLNSFKGIVANLLIDAINSNTGVKNIIVHLSREDYPEISLMKDIILTETGMMENNIEFIQDATLGVNGCVIETDNGIFDCSLDTELAELKKKLTLLSYR